MKTLMDEERLKDFERSLEKINNVVIEDLSKLWIEYDRQTDTLYLYFGKEEAEESLMLENDIIVLLRNKKLIGLIINDFGSRYLS